MRPDCAQSQVRPDSRPPDPAQMWLRLRHTQRFFTRSAALPLCCLIPMLASRPDPDSKSNLSASHAFKPFSDPSGVPTHQPTAATLPRDGVGSHKLRAPESHRTVPPSATSQEFRVSPGLLRFQGPPPWVQLTCLEQLTELREPLYY